MAQHYNPHIVTDNLMFHVDAADRVSYYSGSTTWKDLSGNGRDGILSGSGGTRGTIGTVSSSEAVGGAMSFDNGVDQISITSTGTPGGAQSTGAGPKAFGNNADISVEAWVKGTKTDGGIIGEWRKSSGYNGTTGNWQIQDTKRLGYNDKNVRMLGNTAETERTDQMWDMLSNGFKLTASSGDCNGDGNTYTYMAFAEAPFVNSNGVPCNAR